MQGNDRSSSVFENAIDRRTYAKACRSKERMKRRYGFDGHAELKLKAEQAPAIGQALGAKLLLPANTGEDAAVFGEDAVIVGTIRMGYGHYRIAIALASAARALGYTPYILDLMAFPDTACTKIVSHQNDLYSAGSRLSQRLRLFNKLVWEPLNSEGFRKLVYNAADQKTAELLVEPYSALPKDVPFIAAHAWPAQAAVHAGLKNVANAIPDNWPMALHLSEGAVHTVQTPSAYLGYKTLRGMAKGRVLKPMPAGSIEYTGHYVDHEIVAGIEKDCERRSARAMGGKPVRYLVPIGGAGAQYGLVKDVVEHLMPLVRAGKAELYVNCGDHSLVCGKLRSQIQGMDCAYAHFGGIGEVEKFAKYAMEHDTPGVHLFCDDEKFSAVYATNLLMRCCDVLVTKPSELAYYPVPKIMIKRVGGHEAWGAIRSAEIGDGTFELESAREICAFIDLLGEQPETIAFMCDNIEAAHRRHVYSGAYKAVQIATRALPIG